MNLFKDDTESEQKNLQILNEEHDNAINVNEKLQNDIDTMTVKLAAAEKLVNNLSPEQNR